VVVDQLDIIRAAVAPCEADAVLIIDADTVLSCAGRLELLEIAPELMTWFSLGPKLLSLAAFAASRRDALAQIPAVAQRRGQISRSAATELAVDQVFGVLWYRMIFGHQPLDLRTARQLAEALATQLTTAPGVS
jgi:Tetracyclin repressor-like, C-terminal domain